MTRAGTVGVLAVLTLALVAGVTTATAGAATPEEISGTQTDIDPDRVLLRADVRGDGTADWTIEYRVLLDDQNASDAFENISAEIRADPAPYTTRFEERMERTVGSAANTTGRAMTLRNVSVETDRQIIGQSYGIVRYRFSWTGFAVANETHLTAGDALAGFYLDSESQLRIDWPGAYRVVSVTPTATEQLDRAVVWQGSRDFGGDGPRVVATSDPVTAEPTPTPANESDGSSPLLAIFLVALAGVGGAFLAYRQGLFERLASDEATQQTPTDDTDADDEPPAELLSNEEQVLRLLDREGGRIKQQQVATELDWTDAKTSQVVSKLREQDEIDVFRLGRENVLTLPDDDGI